MIRTCLFDMGNVLVHFSHETMCAQMGALCGRSAVEIRAILFDAGLQVEFECGRVSEQEFHHRFQQAVGATVDIDALRHAGSDIFRLNPPMPSLLDALQRRGVRLVLLSNTSVSHFHFVRNNFDVLQPFDEYVVSYKVGAVKPAAAMYQAAAAAVQCDPGECFYTDDIPHYVETGRSHGFDAEVFTDAGRLLEQLARRGIELSDHPDGDV